MTIAEKLRAMGAEEGLERGLEQGQEKWPLTDSKKVLNHNL
jgi:hypothetical protein